jgi:hypothetical protein
MLVITAIFCVISFLSRGPMSAVLESDMVRNMHAAMAKNPQMTEAMAEKAQKAAAGIGNYAWMFAILTPVMIIIVGLVLWIAGKLVGSRQTAAQGIAVATFAFVPRIIQGIVNWAQLLVLDSNSLNGVSRLSIGPARFVDPDSATPLLLAFLGRFDVFVIWSTVLLAIGLSVTGNVTRKQGAVGAFLVWLFATAAMVIGPIMQQGQ